MLGKAFINISTVVYSVYSMAKEPASPNVLANPLLRIHSRELQSGHHQNANQSSFCWGVLFTPNRWALPTPCTGLYPPYRYSHLDKPSYMVPHPPLNALFAGHLIHNVMVILGCGLNRGLCNVIVQVNYTGFLRTNAMQLDRLH